MMEEEILNINMHLRMKKYQSMLNFKTSKYLRESYRHFFSENLLKMLWKTKSNFFSKLNDEKFLHSKYDSLKALAYMLTGTILSFHGNLLRKVNTFNNFSKIIISWE